MLLLHVKVKR